MGATRVDAYNLNGCKFSSQPVYYKIQSASSGWVLSQSDAASRWTASSAPAWIYQTTGSGQNIDVWSASYVDTWYGLTSGGCPPGGHQVWYGNKVTIKYNERTTSGFSAAKTVAIATHELGHSLGLAHNNNSIDCALVHYQIMYYDATVPITCSTTEPWFDDTDGVAHV
jgi:matrixin